MYVCDLRRTRMKCNNKTITTYMRIPLKKIATASTVQCPVNLCTLYALTFRTLIFHALSRIERVHNLTARQNEFQIYYN